MRLRERNLVAKGLVVVLLVPSAVLLKIKCSKVDKSIVKDESTPQSTNAVNAQPSFQGKYPGEVLPKGVASSVGSAGFFPDRPPSSR
jgi:hypothetical protein